MDVAVSESVAIEVGKSIDLGIIGADSASIDAFGRWRVSNPETIFDSKNVFDDNGLAANVENLPLLFDNQETAGGGTSTAYNATRSSQSLAVAATTAGTRVRQTRMRFNYQPGKSQLIFRTFNMNGINAGNTKRIGIFDANNGLFLQNDGSNIAFVRRTSTSGSPVDNPVLQASWNLDTMDGNGNSGIALDWTKTQILVMDYEWLGVGRVRLGFVIKGQIRYAHQFLNANVFALVYMQTPNLPLRTEIINSGTGIADSIEDICSSIISEGGSEDLGSIRYASTNGTHVDCDVENTIYAILGIRLKSAYLGATINLLNAALQLQSATDLIEWILKLNPTVAGTFTYNDETNSAVQIARGALANTVTGGHNITGGYLESGGAQLGNAGSGGDGINNAIRLGSLINGTPDTFVLCARPVGGTTSADVEGSLNWRESL